MGHQQKMAVIKSTATFTASSTTDSQPVQQNGFVHNVLIKVANFTNAVTATVTVKDLDGDELFNSGAIARNTTLSLGSLDLGSGGVAELGSVPVDYNYTVNTVLSGAAGGTGGTVITKLFCKF